MDSASESRPGWDSHPNHGNHAAAGERRVGANGAIHFMKARRACQVLGRQHQDLDIGGVLLRIHLRVNRKPRLKLPDVD